MRVSWLPSVDSVQLSGRTSFDYQNALTRTARHALDQSQAGVAYRSSLRATPRFVLHRDVLQ